MYSGKDINIVELFKLYKTIHEKAGMMEECPTEKWFDLMIQENFNQALGVLKYNGFLSATRQSTFLFKKNIFGKPKYYSIGQIS